jgi:hypothetical protein
MDSLAVSSRVRSISTVPTREASLPAVGPLDGCQFDIVHYAGHGTIELTGGGGRSSDETNRRGKVDLRPQPPPTLFAVGDAIRLLELAKAPARRRFTTAVSDRRCPHWHGRSSVLVRRPVADQERNACEGVLGAGEDWRVGPGAPRSSPVASDQRTIPHGSAHPHRQAEPRV